MDQENSARSSRNAYLVAMAVAVVILARQILTTGSYDTEVFGIVLLSQVGYWSSVVYYEKTDGELPLLDD